MSRLTVLAIASSISAISFSGVSHAADKCYESISVPAQVQGAGSSSKSADFTTGCKWVPEHVEQQEIACPVGKWVNVSANTQMGTAGKVVTQAQVCATAGMVPFSINGKVCASGERPARQGIGWEGIVYKYGLKGGGNGNDGGDKLEAVSRQSFGGGRDGDSGAGRSTTSGTMCYDRNMGTKNNTKQDAAIAVYCK